MLVMFIYPPLHPSSGQNGSCSDGCGHSELFNGGVERTIGGFMPINNGNIVQVTGHGETDVGNLGPPSTVLVTSVERLDNTCHSVRQQAAIFLRRIYLWIEEC